MLRVAVAQRHQAAVLENLKHQDLKQGRVRQENYTPRQCYPSPWAEVGPDVQTADSSEGWFTRTSQAQAQLPA